MNYGLDVREMINKLIRYLIQGLAVALAAYYVPKKGKISLENVAMISLTAAATMATVELLLPQSSGGLYQGVGFGLGANLVGFPQ